jgi:hypothetical protein
MGSRLIPAAVTKRSTCGDCEGDRTRYVLMNMSVVD